MGERIISPCVGVCSTTLGDRVCRGCQRTVEEIRDWPALSADERRRRLEALDRLRAEVAARFLVVEDAERLEAQLRRHRIRFRDAQPALSRAVELLRVGRGRIRELSRYGLTGRDNQQDAAVLHARISHHLLVVDGQRQVPPPVSPDPMTPTP